MKYNGCMGYINLSTSLRYGPHGKKRKTRAFTQKSKKQKYEELLLSQQKQFDQVMKQIKEEYPSMISEVTGNITPKKEPMQYTGERKLLGIATLHKSNMIPIFEDDKEHAKDVARMRR